MGGYDLIALTRQTPDAGWMATNATGQSIGSACFASQWYDYLLGRVEAFVQVPCSVVKHPVDLFSHISRYKLW